MVEFTYIIGDRHLSRKKRNIFCKLGSWLITKQWCCFTHFNSQHLLFLCIRFISIHEILMAGIKNWKLKVKLSLWISARERPQGFPLSNFINLIFKRWLNTNCEVLFIHFSSFLAPSTFRVQCKKQCIDFELRNFIGGQPILNFCKQIFHAFFKLENNFFFFGGEGGRLYYRNLSSTQ